VEKGNFEGERAKRIAFPSETYTYASKTYTFCVGNVYVLGAGSFTSQAERLSEE